MEGAGQPGLPSHPGRVDTRADRATGRAALGAQDALDVILSAAEQGILLHDGRTVLLANRRAAELLDCPIALLRQGASLQAFVNYCRSRGDYGPSGNQTLSDLLDMVRASGTLEVERRVAGRFVRVNIRMQDRFFVVSYTDVTAARLREDQLRRSRAKIRELAVHDGLTGLLNRSTFDSRLSDVLAKHYLRAIPEQGQRPALLAIDLDGFKRVNDMRGHQAGDAVLRTLAERFTETLAQQDEVARLGGDEFAIITSAGDKAALEGLAHRICAVARQPIRTDAGTVAIGASVGMAAAPDKVTSPSDMVRYAELALDVAKEKGGGATVAYTPDMLVDSLDRAELEADLRRAVANDELVLHYQVQIDVRAQTVVGYEALMRWNHPTRGLVLPGEFIPLAERTGLIVELGRWALRRATMDFAKADDRLRVAVNVSPTQVLECDLAREVREALRLSGLSPGRLEVEVTEDILIEDTERTRAVLEELREMDVVLALDDFGSGYSSLAYLTLFPFNKIKIDRSFVNQMRQDPRASTLVSSILAMAGALSLKVNAEGVETSEEFSTLMRLGCDEMQGFLLGKPTPLEDLVAEGLTRNAAMMQLTRSAKALSSVRAALGAAGYGAATDLSDDANTTDETAGADNTKTTRVSAA